jgi:DNA-binding transcriptional LysR family regulator
LEHELQAGTLAAVPFTPQNFVRPLGIVYRRGRRLNPNTEAFMELLQHGGSTPPSQARAQT